MVGTFEHKSLDTLSGTAERNMQVTHMHEVWATVDTEIRLLSAYSFESLFLDLGRHALISHNSVQEGCNALLGGGDFLLLVLRVGDLVAE